MNFFEHQDKARQNTRKLVLLYGLSIAGITISVYLAALITSWMVGANSGRSSVRFSSLRRYSPQVVQSQPDSIPPQPTVTARPLSLWEPQIFLWSAVPTMLLIGGATALKLQELRQGGAIVAQELGGRLLLPEIATLLEQQLLNVVDEMAIAASIPPPPVYVLDSEPSINAFAAGHTIRDAVIGVTRGSLEQLTRDELQGVIGHEFSHILNGDMRLNMRLVGALHGIILVYLCGRLIIRFSDTSDRDWNAVVFLGMALMAIGGIGHFFSRLIQSAVSRQREFLADASAVQFTRNPDGLAGAFQKIEANSYRSLVASPYAEEMSHLFFGSALKVGWLEGDWFATHPPIQQRIKRLGVVARQQSEPRSPLSKPATASSHQPATVMGFAGGLTPSDRATSAPKTAIAPAHTAQPAWITDLPVPLRIGVQEYDSAVAIACSLMLDPHHVQHRTQQETWLQTTDAVLAQSTCQFGRALDVLNPRLRLPLLDLALPALQNATAEQCQQLFTIIQGLAKVDGKWSLSELVVYLGLWHRLQPCLKPNLLPTESLTTLDPVWSDCLSVLSALAQVGQPLPDAASFAFRSSLYELPGAATQELPATLPVCNFSQLIKSLDRLTALSAKLKQAIASACTSMVLLDRKVTMSEAELLWAIATYLDCPIPPCLQPTRK